jgi:hypothetical protein
MPIPSSEEADKTHLNISSGGKLLMSEGGTMKPLFFSLQGQLGKNELAIKLSTTAMKGPGLVQWFTLCSFLCR